MRETSDVRIARSQPLVTPKELASEFPIDENASEFVWQSRRQIEAIVSGEDNRLLCIVGPCSVHDTAALLDFAVGFKEGTADLKDAILPALRVYFEKPRSVIGWKGLINDPDLDGSFHISKGLRLARELLIKVAELELPESLIVDCSHGNSEKNHERQLDVASDVAGQQSIDASPLTYGQSITDACLALPETLAALQTLAEAVKKKT